MATSSKNPQKSQTQMMSLTGTLRLRHFRPTQICSHSPGIKIEDENSILRISCCVMLDRLCLCLRDNHDLFLDILQRLAICNGSGAGAGLHLNWIFSYDCHPQNVNFPIIPRQGTRCHPVVPTDLPSCINFALHGAASLGSTWASGTVIGQNDVALMIGWGYFGGLLGVFLSDNDILYI